MINGYTLDMSGVRIRLLGIHAPESEQSCQAQGKQWSCGCKAMRALVGRIGERSVVCQERDPDRHSRVAALCGISGMELNGWMVAGGRAFAYRRYSHSVAEESRLGQQDGECGAAKPYRRGIGVGQPPCRDAGEDSTGERVERH